MKYQSSHQKQATLQSNYRKARDQTLMTCSMTFSTTWRPRKALALPSLKGPRLQTNRYGLPAGKNPEMTLTYLTTTLWTIQLLDSKKVIHINVLTTRFFSRGKKLFSVARSQVTILATNYLKTKYFQETMHSSKGLRQLVRTNLKPKISLMLLL